MKGLYPVIDSPYFCTEVRLSGVRVSVLCNGSSARKTVFGEMRRLCKTTKILLIRGLVSFFNALGLKKNLYSISPKRFLIVSTTGIGDTLWGTPAIRALKEGYKDGYISVMTTDTGAELLKENPYIDRVFIFRRGKILSLFGLIRDLRKERFEMAFIFHASDRIIWPLVFFSGVSEIIGMIGQNKGLDFILTRGIRQEAVHGVEMRLRLIREAGVYNSESASTIYLTGEERKRGQEILEEMGFHETSLIIGLHPGAQKPFKCWPLRNFVETGNRLVKDLGCRIVVTGGNKERRLCEELASKITGAVSVAGITSLRETAAIIERMSLFITNDTGPMHMAFALETPTIALFSPTDPVLCGPYNAKSAVIIKKPIICSPCIGKGCSTPVCMEQITAYEVIDAAESLLERKCSSAKARKGS